MQDTERRWGGEAGNEEVLALEQAGRGEGRSGWGGRVIIFSQEFPHLKSSLGAPSLYICSRLLHHAAAASGPWLCGAIYSASLCVRVCAARTHARSSVRRSEQSLHVQVRMHAGSWLSFEFINYNSLSFIQVLSVAAQNTFLSSLSSFSLVSLRFCAPTTPPTSLFLFPLEEQTPVLHQRTRDFSAWTNNLLCSTVYLLQLSLQDKPVDLIVFSPL